MMAARSKIPVQETIEPVLNPDQIEQNGSDSDGLYDPSGSGGDQVANWNFYSKFELKSLILETLDKKFRSAIETIMSDRYTRVVAAKALLANAHSFDGSEDHLRRIIEKSLSDLENARDIGHASSSSESVTIDDDLFELELSTASDLIRRLRDIKPSFSKGDAMWFLLMFDVNFPHACNVLRDPKKYLKLQKYTPGYSTKEETLSFIQQGTSSIKPLRVDSLDRAIVYDRRSKKHSCDVKTSSNRENGKNSSCLPKVDTREEDLTTANVKSTSAALCLYSRRSSSLKRAKNSSTTPITSSTESSSTVVSTGCSTSSFIKTVENYLSSSPKVVADDLSSKIQFLESCVQLQHARIEAWTEWAQFKVMQATKKLSKDKEQIQALRKEKNMMRESIEKKLVELEKAFPEFGTQIRLAKATAQLLEKKNSRLRKEIEEVKSEGREAEEEYLEHRMKGMKNKKRLDACEEQKALLHEELKDEKHKLKLLQKELQNAKQCSDQIQARLRQEEKLKEKALTQKQSAQQQREKMEALARAQEQELISKAASHLQSYQQQKNTLQHQIRELENHIIQLRMESDQSSSSSSSNIELPLDWELVRCTRDILEMMDPEEYGRGDMRRDRECVMCLTTEISVVFLPCAHQVVCMRCNELHEKQGMRECPACRTPIQRRIKALVL